MSERTKREIPDLPRWDGPLSHPFYSRVVKRIIDFLLALVLLVPAAVVMIPLAVPTMMTVGMFYFIARWNDFYNAMIYLSKRSQYPLQLLLREMLIESTDSSTYMMFMSGKDAITPFAYRSALILVAMLPMLVLYAVFQKYFIET